VPRPEQGAEVSVESSPGGRLDLGFDPGQADFSRPENSNDLVFEVEGGGKVTIVGFFEVGDESLPALTLPDGVEVAATDFFAGSDMDMTTAAGPGRASGSGTSYDDNAGSLLDGLDKYGKLGTDQWGRGSENEEEYTGTTEIPGGSFSFSIISVGPGGSGTEVPSDERPGAVAGGHYNGIFEDWKANQHLDGEAAAETPARLVLDFTGTGTTVVDGVALSGFTPGTEVYTNGLDSPPIVVESADQVVNVTAGQLDGGVYIKPPANDDTDMTVNAQVTLRAESSGLTETIGGSFEIIVDAAADKPVDVQAAADAVDYATVAVDMDKDAVKSNEDGWNKTEFDAAHTEAVVVEIPAALDAGFNDFDGSESHTLYVAVPSPAEGWTALGPDGEPLAIVHDVPGHEGQAFYEVPENLITFDADGKAHADLTFRHESDNLAGSDIPSDPLTVVAVARETASDDELTTANNTAYTVSEDTLDLSVNNINAGLTIQAGWGSEGGDDAKHLASGEHVYEGAEAGATDDGAAPVRIAIDGDGDDFISSVTLTWDPADGYLRYDGEGTAVYSDPSGSVTITFTAGQAVTDLEDSLKFEPAPGNDSDSDVNLKYEVVVENSDGARAEYSGETVVVIDAVADRGDTGAVKADYIEHDGIAEATAAAPGDVVKVSGSASFNDPDGSELHYAVIAVPDAAWSIAGLGHAQLLDADAVKAHWQNAGGMPDNNDDVNSALDGAVKGDGPFLLIEADSASGEITIYAMDAAGNAVALDKAEYADLYGGISYDKATGELTWTVPVQTPELTGDGSLEVASWGVALEKDPGDGEYDYANNISAGDVQNTSVDVDVITGNLVINPALTDAGTGLYEDNRPGQWTDAAGDKIVAEGVDADTSAGLAGPFGVPLFELQDGSSSEYVKSVTFTELPDASEGTLYYKGEPVTGLTVTDPSGEVDLSELTFKPTDNYSGNVDFTYEAELASHATGQVITQDPEDITVHVESVADLAVAHVNDVTQDTVQGDFFDVAAEDGAAEKATDGAAADYTGWFVSHADNETPVSATLDLSATLNDLDGSEHAQILVEVGTGTSAGDFAGNGITVAGHDDPGKFEYIDGKAYAVFTEGEASALVNENGDGNFTVPLLVEHGTEGSVRVIVRTEETGSIDGNQGGNDVAMREVASEDLNLAWLSTSMTVKTGWASEGLDNDKHLAGDATHSLPGDAVSDAASTSSIGAPVAVEFSNLEAVDGITFVYKQSDGTLLVDGQTIQGVETFTGADGETYCRVTIPNDPSEGKYNPFNQLQGGRLTFKPADGHSDTDITLQYAVEVDEGGHKFLVSGETTVVVDAVADLAAVTGSEYAADDAADGTIVVSVAAAFADNDGSERHYVLVEKPATASGAPEWTCTDPGAEVVTVYYDAAGNVLPPVWNPETQSYDDPTPDPNGYSKEFFQVEVTGETGPYDVHLTPPAGSEDVTLAVGTLAVEQVDYTGEDGKVNEYDYSNNHAYNIVEDGVHVNLLNSDLTAGAAAAYEDHDKDVSTNYTGASQYQETGDGIITLTINGQGETLDTAAGKEFTLSFDFAGDGDPGTFSIGGVNYTPEFVDGHWVVTVPAASLGSAYNSANGTISIRYNPPANDDTDLTGLHFSVPVKAGDSGFTADLEADLGTLVVDAVADRPASAGVSADYNGEQTAAKPGEAMDLKLTAKFSDFDGSEEHSVIVELPAGFGVPSLSGEPLTQLSPGRIAELNARGAGLDPNRTYYEVEVADDAVNADGTVNITLNVTAPDVIATSGDGDTSYSVKVIAHAHETAAADAESDTKNNDAFTEGKTTVNVGAVVDDTHNPNLNLKAQAYEDHAPNQNTGNYAENAASGKINLLHDASDQVDSLTLTCSKEEAGEGYLTYKGQKASTDPNAEFSVTEDDDGNLVYTIKNYDQNAANGGLRFNPGPNSDGDVNFTWSADVHDKNSGYSAEGTEDWTGKFTVTVDAVADDPVGASAGNLVYTDKHGVEHHASRGGNAEPGGTVAIEVSASFGDFADGSERQYLVVQRPNANWTTPEESDGLLNYGGKTYFRYDVTDEIDAADAVRNFLAGNTLDGYTVIDNQDGTYTVNNGTAEVSVTVSGDTYTVGDVDVSFTADGKADVSLTAELDIPENYATKNTGISAGGVAVDRGSVDANGNIAYNSPDGEITTGNNVADDLKSVTVVLGTIESAPKVSVGGFVFENNDPNAHLSDQTAAIAPEGQEWNAARTIGDDAIAQAGASIHVEGIAQGETGHLQLTFAAQEADGTPTDLSGGQIIYNGTTYYLVDDPQNPGSYTPAATEGGAPVAIPVGPTGAAGVDLTFKPADNFSGRDISVKADVTVTDDNSGREQSYTNDTVLVGDGVIEVDAVAQAAEIVAAGGAEGVEGHENDVVIGAMVQFEDYTDGSETHYLLVEAQTGIGKPSYIIIYDDDGNKHEYPVPANVGWEPVDGIGNFWRIPVDNEWLVANNGTLTAQVGFKNISDWRRGDDLAMRVGALSEESTEAMDGEHFHSGSDVNNNVAHTIAPDPVTTKVPSGTGTGGGSGLLLTIDAYEDGQPNSYLGDDTTESYPVDLVKLADYGELSGQIAGGHDGDRIVYDGTTYEWDGAGFVNNGTYLDWKDVDTGKQMTFTPGGEDDTDRSLSVSVNGVPGANIWIRVDAVADRPVADNASYVDAERDNGEHYAAAQSEGKVIASTSLTFDDTDGSETHYAVLQKHPEWKLDSLRVTIDGETYTWEPGQGWEDSQGVHSDLLPEPTTVFGRDGTPYYAVELPDGAAEADVEFILNAPGTDEDRSQNLKIGGIAVEEATGAPGDMGGVEETLDNNWAEDIRYVTVSAAVVETESLTMTGTGELTEDDTVNGITLHFEGFADTDGAVDATYAGGNPERITSLALEITQPGTAADKPIGTIDYDGEVAVTINGVPYEGDLPVEVKPGDTVVMDFGDAGYDEGKFKFAMAEDNHNGGKVTINAVPTVTDVDSGDSKEMAPVKVDVDPKDIADAATNVDVYTVDHNTAVAGIQAYAQPGGQVAFTVGADFPDGDGSESHYILVEARDGWTCNNSGATTIYLNDQGEIVGPNDGGTAYFRIPASSPSGFRGEPTVKLTVPKDYPDDDSVSLKVGALSMENTGGDYKVHFDDEADEAVVTIGAVQAGGVGFNADSTGVHEDGANAGGDPDSVPGAQLNISITGGAGYDADAAHETLQRLTIDLKGGTLVDADGNVVSTNGVLNTPELIAQALNGGLYYQPAPNAGGDIALNYTAVIQDTNSGATKTVSGSDTVHVTAVTDAPNDVDQSTKITDGTHHQGTATITVKADFTGGDLDGSETHFVLLSLPPEALANMPAGWAPAGWTRLADGDPKAGELDDSGNVVFARDVSNTAATPEASFSGLILDENFEGEFIYAAGSRDGSEGEYKFTTGETGTLHTGDINVNPNVPDDAAKVADILRPDAPSVTDSLSLHDADGDDVDVVGISSRGNTAAVSTEDDGKLLVEGRYGFLSIDKETGEYTYTLKPEYQGEGGIGLNGAQDVFDVSVIDDHGGTDGAAITITLGAPNTPPTANADRLSVGGGDENDTAVLTAEGNLNLYDAHGDEVTITPDAAWTEVQDGWKIEGDHGYLILKADGSYTYHLTDEHYDGQETFDVSFKDSFNAAGSTQITVDVDAVNHAPEVDDVTSRLTEISKGMKIGNLADLYRDKDAEAGNQGDTLLVALTAIDVFGVLRTVEVPETGSVSLELQHGTLTVLANGTYTYVAHDQAGAHTQDVWDSVTVTVTDSNGLQDSGNLNFALGSPAGDPPSIIQGTEAADTFDGSANADAYHGGAGADTIAGGAGDDTLSGGDGDDVITGDTGNDVIYGGAGDDTIYGGEGDDTIYGGDGVDIIYGGEGNDVIYGGAGGGIISGGAGDDLLIAPAGHGATEFRWVSEDLGGYQDTIQGFDVGQDSINLKDIIGTPETLDDLIRNASWEDGKLTVRDDNGTTLTAQATDSDTLVLTLSNGAGNDPLQTITIEASDTTAFANIMDGSDAAAEEAARQLLQQMIQNSAG
jgi:hypothetical protein